MGWVWEAGKRRPASRASGVPHLRPHKLRGFSFRVGDSGFRV